MTIAPHAPPPLHTFQIGRANDGAMFLVVFKRVDLRRVEQVAFVTVLDKTIAPEVLGERICAELDDELATRAKREGAA